MTLPILVILYTELEFKLETVDQGEKGIYRYIHQRF